MESVANFFFNSLIGLVLLAALIVAALCVAAMPFVVMAKLVRMERHLQELCEMEHRRGETLETINRNLGQLLLHLPRILKDALAGAESSREPPVRPGPPPPGV